MCYIITVCILLFPLAWGLHYIHFLCHWWSSESPLRPPSLRSSLPPLPSLPPSFPPFLPSPFHPFINPCSTSHAGIQKDICILGFCQEEQWSHCVGGRRSWWQVCQGFIYIIHDFIVRGEGISLRSSDTTGYIMHLVLLFNWKFPHRFYFAVRLRHQNLILRKFASYCSLLWLQNNFYLDLLIMSLIHVEHINRENLVPQKFPAIQ